VTIFVDNRPPSYGRSTGYQQQKDMNPPTLLHHSSTSSHSSSTWGEATTPHGLDNSTPRNRHQQAGLSGYPSVVTPTSVSSTDYLRYNPAPVVSSGLMSSQLSSSSGLPIIPPITIDRSSYDLASGSGGVSLSLPPQIDPYYSSSVGGMGSSSHTPGGSYNRMSLPSPTAASTPGGGYSLAGPSPRQYQPHTPSSLQHHSASAAMIGGMGVPSMIHGAAGVSHGRGGSGGYGGQRGGSSGMGTPGGGGMGTPGGMRRSGERGGGMDRDDDGDTGRGGGGGSSSNAQGRAVNKMLLDILRERVVDINRLNLAIETFIDRMDCVNLATLLFHTGKKRLLLSPPHIKVIADRFNLLNEELRAREASNALYGLKCLSSDVPEVRELVYALARKIASSSSEFVAQAVGNTFYTVLSFAFSLSCCVS
jgi:hypothetical protein